MVDFLPERLWKPGNLHLGCRLHFCDDVAPDGAPDTFVRTIEWNGRAVAHGRRPIDFERWNARWPGPVE